MATIHDPWTNNLLDGSVDHGDKIDDQMNKLARNVQDRLVNGGHYVPDDANDRSGLHVISSNNYYPDEWNVCRESGGKVITITDTLFHVDIAAEVVGQTTLQGNVQVNGDADFSAALRHDGYDVIDKNGPKRYVTMTTWGVGNSESGATQLHLHRLVVPFDCTLVRVTAARDDSAGSTQNFKLYQGTPTYSTDGSYSYFDADPSFTAIIDKDIPADWWGFYRDLTTSVTAGDVFYAFAEGSRRWTVSLTFEVPW